jgi:hypothetical protein
MEAKSKVKESVDEVAGEEPSGPEGKGKEKEVMEVKSKVKESVEEVAGEETAMDLAREFHVEALEAECQQRDNLVEYWRGENRNLHTQIGGLQTQVGALQAQVKDLNRLQFSLKAFEGSHYS